MRLLSQRQVELQYHRLGNCVCQIDLFSLLHWDIAEDWKWHSVMSDITNAGTSK